MRRAGHRSGALLALAVLALFAASTHAQPGTIWRPQPKNPLQLNKPEGFDKIAENECPKECVTNGCCTMAWDAMSYVAFSMPRDNCTYCQSLRYTVGRLPKSEEVTCQSCLMEDFKTVISNFKCANDNGRCTKCCMDLSLIWVSRFQFGCPNALNKAVARFSYKDTGFVYDGSSSCPRPPPSPSPPLPPGTVQQFNTPEEMLAFFTQAPPPDSVPDDYDYLDSSDIGVAGGVDLVRPNEVLQMQKEAGVRPGGM